MQRPTRLFAPLLTLTLATAPAVAGAQVTIPLTPYLERLHTVQVVIGNETLDFLFDTGGGTTVISPEVAARVGCAADGRAIGFRMRGDKIVTPTCAEIGYRIAGIDLREEASVFDLMSLIGPDQTRVDGLISLKSFAGRAITLDTKGNTLTVETPRSLARRTAQMTPLRARLANGLAGGDLDAFIGIPAGPRTLWLLWDSGHLGPLFFAPHSLRLLGIADTLSGGELALPLAPALRPHSTYRPVNVIYDGVIGEELIRRAVWTLDLAAGRLWVGLLRE